MIELCWRFCYHIVFIHYSSMPKHLSKLDYSRKKPQRMCLKTWNWLQVEIIACGISWSELNKERNLQGWYSHSLGVLFFYLWVFKGCNTLLWMHTFYDFRIFSQNFQNKHRNINGVFTKAFPQPLCLFFSGTDHW